MSCYAANILSKRETKEIGTGGGHATIAYGCNIPSLTEYIDLLFFIPYHCLMFMLLVLML